MDQQPMMQHSASCTNSGINVGGTVNSEYFLPFQIFGNNNCVEVNRLAGPSKRHEPITDKIEYGVMDPIESYTDRKDAMDNLLQVIQQKKSKDEVTILSLVSVITGMGGVGKTEIVRKYISLYKNLYGHTLWVNAETFSEMTNCFNTIAAQCNIAKQSDANPVTQQAFIERIYSFICQKPALIIFDNAESLDDSNTQHGIRPFLPQTVKTGWVKPVIIATSRNRDDWKRLVTIELLGLTELECYELLKSQLKFQDTEDNRYFARKIKLLCGGLPLVVQQVIAIIRDETEDREAIGEREFNMEDFLKEYNEDGRDYTAKKPADSPVGASVFDIFKMTFRKLDAKENGALCIRILIYMSMLNPDSIPTRLLLHVTTDEELSKKQEALKILHKHNLITRCKNYYKIHRVTQMVTLYAVKIGTIRMFCGTNDNSASTASSVLNSLIRSVQAYLSEEQPTRFDYAENFLTLENGIRLANHIKEIKWGSNSTIFLQDLAEKLSNYGKHHDAEMLLRKILNGLSQYGCNALPFRIRTSLATACSFQGKYDDAIAILEEVLKQQERIFKPGDLKILFTKNMLANAIANQGKSETAQKLFQEILQIREQQLGPTHPQTLTSKHNLANCFRRQHKFDRAAELYEFVLKHREIKLGPQHFQTLKTKQYLANITHKSEDSIKNYEEILKTLSPNHPETLITKHNLANAFYCQGDYEKAEELYEFVLSERQRIFGLTHPGTLATKNNLALVLALQGKTANAIKIYEDVLQNRLAMFGPDHPDTLSTHHNLAFAYTDLRRYKESVVIYKDVHQRRENVLGPNHPKTLATKANLADALAHEGELKNAVQLFEDVLKAREETCGPTHSSTLVTKQNLAKLFLRVGEYERSAELYESVLTCQKVTLGDSHPDLMTTKFNYACALSKQGKLEKAVVLFENVLKYDENTLRANHTHVLLTKEELASVFCQQGEFDKAEDLYNNILNCLETTLTPSNPIILTLKQKLAEVLRKRTFMMNLMKPAETTAKIVRL